MPRMKELHIDGHALGFTLVISLATGLIFGCAPALRAARDDLSDALKQAPFKSTVGVGRRRYRSALVVVELALTLVLLAGAGLMIESIIRLLGVNPGFDPENLLRVHIQLPWEKYNDPEHNERASQLRSVFFAELHERLAALPGVKVVGIGKHGAWPEKLKIEGRDALVELLQDGSGVGQSDLFRAMRVPLRAGRYFEQRDIGDGTGTAIINETMARTFWPGQDAIGKKFGGTTWRGPRQYEVVGVVSDMHDERYDQQLRPTFYRPCHEVGLEGLRPFVVIRTETDPRVLIPAVRKEMKAVEPEMRMPTIYLVRQALYDGTQARRTYMYYLVIFACVGVMLSALGIYGVLTYSVARRTQEIGIRMALGVGRPQVLGMVLAEGIRLASLGVAAGLIAAYWLTRLLEHQLFEVRPIDPIAFSGAVIVLFAVALLACWLPARRAARMDPMDALRYE